MPSLFPQSGPSLPSFSSLLITGDYHPSAPIYLCLSSISEIVGPKAILISSSRESLKTSLQHYNDEWLKVNFGHGNTTSLSSRVQLFYPPSPAHLCCLFSMLTVSRDSHLEMGPWMNNQTTLAATPFLIVLHEPSAYFLTSDSSSVSLNWTVSSYLSLVAHALSCVSFLSNNARSLGVSFALFDSRLEQLQLPMVKSPTSHNIDNPEALDSPRLEHVHVFVLKYFEWRIIFTEAVPHSENSQRKRRMALHRINGSEEAVKMWTWWEGPDDDSIQSEKQATRLFWEH